MTDGLASELAAAVAADQRRAALRPERNDAPELRLRQGTVTVGTSGTSTGCRVDTVSHRQLPEGYEGPALPQDGPATNVTGLPLAVGDKVSMLTLSGARYVVGRFRVQDPAVDLSSGRSASTGIGQYPAGVSVQYAGSGFPTSFGVATTTKGTGSNTRGSQSWAGSDGSFWVRSATSSTAWGPWSPDLADIGDYVIHDGANGTAVRRPGGLQTAWADITLTYATTVALNATWTFPAAFAAPPSVTWLPASTGGMAASEAELMSPRVTSVSTSSAGLRIARITGGPNLGTGDSLVGRCMAVGLA